MSLMCKLVPKDCGFKLIDLLRIIFGFIITAKGFYFLTDTEYFEKMNMLVLSNNFVVIHYIDIVNIIGGLMIILGFFARWFIIAQIPILIGAILIHFIYCMNLQIVLLLFFLVLISVGLLKFGSGRFSLQYYIIKKVNLL